MHESPTPVSSLLPFPVKHVPKHRAAKHRAEPTRSGLRLAKRTVVMTSVAAAATGLTVTAGVMKSPLDSADVGLMAAGAAEAPVAAAAQEPTLDDQELAERRDPVSRSDSRDQRDDAKSAALKTGTAPAAAYSENLSQADPRTIAKALLPEYGFSVDQFGCLDSLYVSESNWNMHADNPTSSAYGIPQALTQTHDMPAGYFDSAEVQIRWGLDYIRSAYGSPCNAWSFKQGHNWY